MSRIYAPEWETELNKALINKEVSKAYQLLEDGEKLTQNSLLYSVRSNEPYLVQYILKKKNIPTDLYTIKYMIFPIAITEANNTPSIINMLIEYLKNNNYLELDKSFIDSIISELNDSNNKNKETQKILYSLIFKSCVETEAEKLRQILKDLGVVTINNQELIDLDSEELCKLIESQYNINVVPKTNNSYELKFVD
jgi:hypothetical protein